MNNRASVYRVFKPGADSTYTHIDRDSEEEVIGLQNAVQRPGNLITVVGPTKMGKTILVKRTLPNAMFIDSSWIGTLDDLWSRLAASLRIPTNQSGTRTAGDSSSWGVTAKIKALFAEGSMKVAGTTSNEWTDTWSAELPLDQAVSEAIEVLSGLDNEPVIVIDDFHFIPPQVRAAVVSALKGLCAKGAICVLITLPHHKNEAVSQVQDMIGRSVVRTLGEWDEDDLMEIGKRGFAALNLIDDGDSIAMFFAGQCYGSPHLMQQLCLTLVADVNHITEALDLPTQLCPPSDWDDFLLQHVDSKAIQWLELFIQGPSAGAERRNKFTLNDGSQIDGYQLIFKGLQQIGPNLTTDLSALRAQIVLMLDDQRPENLKRLQLQAKLQQINKIASRSMSAPSGESLEISHDLASPNATHQPLFEYVQETKRVHILEPYLAFALSYGCGEMLA